MRNGDHENKNCFSCVMMGHLDKNFMRKKGRLTENDSGGKKRLCPVCRKPGHSAKDRKVRNGGKYAKSSTTMLMVLTVLKVSFENREKYSHSWRLDPGFTKHMTNRRENFVFFYEQTRYSEGLQLWDHLIPGIWEGQSDCDSRGKGKRRCIESRSV